MVPVVELRTLREADLPEIAALHRAAFLSSALTKLGQGAVRRYYEWQLTGPHAVYPIGAFEHGKLVGFCFSGRFRGAMSGFVRRNATYLGLRVMVTPRLWRVATLRGRVLTLARALIRKPETGPKPKQVSESHQCFSVLAIAVDPSAQRSGVGRALLDDATREARSRGFGCLLLTVRADNVPAVRFYETQGWTRRTDGPGWDGTFVKQLD